MTNIKATRRRPSGFSSPSHYDEHVTIVGFVFHSSYEGGHSYRIIPSPVAIFIDARGGFGYAPVGEFVITSEEEKSADGNEGDDACCGICDPPCAAIAAKRQQEGDST